MSQDPFDGPGSATGIQWANYDGRLLLINAHEANVVVNTAYGESTAVRADITVLDGPDAPEVITDTLIFPKVVQSQVKANAGSPRPNLGRLGRGTAKPGQDAPWTLMEPSDEDRKLATDYLNSTSTSGPPF